QYLIEAMTANFAGQSAPSLLWPSPAITAAAAEALAPDRERLQHFGMCSARVLRLHVGTARFGARLAGCRVRFNPGRQSDWVDRRRSRPVPARSTAHCPSPNRDRMADSWRRPAATGGACERFW